MDIEESIRLVVEGCGVSLYDIAQLKEHDTDIYRIYISSPDGISLDKCSEVSRMLSPVLDIDEPMNGKYSLQVSSPGLERKLKKPNHFQASIGANIRVKSFTSDKTEGILKSADNKEIVLKINNEDDEIIPYDEILAASTFVKW